MPISVNEVRKDDHLMYWNKSCFYRVGAVVLIIFFIVFSTGSFQ